MKLIWVVAGWICVGLGALGVALPVLPTTPLLILAAFCFSKGSKRLHQWLLSNPTFGPLIHEWETRGIIRRRAKISATVAIAAMFSLTLVVAAVAWWIKAHLVLIAVGVLMFIWTRPEE